MNNQNVVSVRMRPEEVDLLRAAAQCEHSTVSEYIRGAASRAAILQQPGSILVRLSNGASLALWTNAPSAVSAWCR